MSIMENIVQKFKISRRSIYPEHRNHAILGLSIVGLVIIFLPYYFVTVKLLSESAVAALQPLSLSIGQEPEGVEEVISFFKELFLLIPASWYVRAAVWILLIPTAIMIFTLWIEARILEGDFSEKQRAKMAELRQIRFGYDQWLLVRLILYYTGKGR